MAFGTQGYPMPSDFIELNAIDGRKVQLRKVVVDVDQLILVDGGTQVITTNGHKYVVVEAPVVIRRMLEGKTRL